MLWLFQVTIQKLVKLSIKRVVWVLTKQSLVLMALVMLSSLSKQLQLQLQMFTMYLALQLLVKCQKKLRSLLKHTKLSTKKSHLCLQLWHMTLFIWQQKQPKVLKLL